MVLSVCDVPGTDTYARKIGCHRSLGTLHQKVLASDGLNVHDRHESLIPLLRPEF